MTSARAQGPVDRAHARAWVAAFGLRVGDEVESFGGAFVLTDVDPEALTFAHPPRARASLLALAELGRILRAAGFTGLRRILVYDVGPRGGLTDVYDLDLDLAYSASNRSIEILREQSYQRGEMDEATLRRLGGRVLDLGCGERARAVVSLREEGIEAYGVDPGARADLRGAYIRAESGTHTSLPAGSMRRIFSSYSVFLYAEDDPVELGRTFDECERLLEPGGRLVFAGTRREDALKALVDLRPGLSWIDSYRNEGSFGPTIVVEKGQK